MNKFAIKIDENVRLSLYKICRLCGIDNPEKSLILEEELLISETSNNDNEPAICKKIHDCIGIQVTKLDRMPQTICTMCRNKINDFFEFREMCVSTNIQTRRLLGLPEEKTYLNKDYIKADVINNSCECAIKIDQREIKKESPQAFNQKNKRKSKLKQKISKPSATLKIDKFKNETSYISKKTSQGAKINALKLERKLSDSKKKLQSLNSIRIQDKKPTKRKGSRLPLLAENAPNRRERLREIEMKKHKLSIISADMGPANKKRKVEPQDLPVIDCAICSKSVLGEIQQHLITEHLPRISLYYCVQCDETIDKKSDIRSHNQWHKMSQTPFRCGRCDEQIENFTSYNRHLQDCKLFVPTTLFNNKFCNKCNKEFETQNLFDWHDCILKTLKCPKCSRQFTRRVILRHIMRCSATSKADTAYNPIVIKVPQIAESSPAMNRFRKEQSKNRRKVKKNIYKNMKTY